MIDTIMASLTQGAGYGAFLLLVFVTATAVVFAVYLLVVRRASPEARLNRLLPAEEAASGPGPALFEETPRGLAATLARPLDRKEEPAENGGKGGLRLRLARAGFRSRLARYNFLALKILLAVAVATGYLFLTAFYRFTPGLAAAALALAIVGFLIPDLVLSLLTRSRQQRIERSLPDALDLMVVCVESGLGLDMTFKRVGEEIRSLCRDLSDEFRLTNLEIRAGRPREESFRAMVERTGIRELGNLMTVLVQTTRFGTSLAKTLRVHSDAIRVRRRQLAEERAAKSTVKLIFPLILFIFPALLIVLAGPAVIRIFKILLPQLGGQ